MTDNNANSPQDSGPQPEQPDADANVYLRFDHRLDSLEEGQKTLKSQIDSLRKPFWQNWKFLGGGTAVLLVFAGYIASLWMDEPEIPRIVHSKFLLSDKALALQLRRARGGTDTEPLAFDTELKKHVTAHLQSEGDAKQYLVSIAATRGVRTYSASRTYEKQSIPVGSLACLLMADEDIVALFTDSSVNAGEMVGGIQDRCANHDPSQPGTVISFTEFTPLEIPFKADPGDRVEVVLNVDASFKTPSGRLVTADDGHTLVEAVLYPDTAIEFGSPSAMNELTAVVSVPNGDERNSLAVFLNDAGLASVDPTRLDPETEAEEYRVDLSVTVTVTPEDKQ